MKIDKRTKFLALLVFAITTLMVYAVVRTVLYGRARYTGSDNLLAFLLILAEFFVMLHGFGYMTHIIIASRSRNKPPRTVLLTTEPSVAIIVAARHEPKAVLAETFLTINNINYKNKKVYFLDDSSDEKYKKEAEELAKEYSLTLFRRDTRHGAKAGVINDCLKTLTEKYIAVFDADSNPMPAFLKELVPIIEANERLAFVQTPQFYSNVAASPISRGAAFQQAVFYEYICEGKSRDDSMFCCGTNVLIRTEALRDVGGFDETTVTEDFSTSVKFHLRHWHTLYYNHVNTFGMGPEDLTGYFTQQFRWANGTIAVFKKTIRAFFANPFALRLNQWWEYFLSGTYYFVGIAFFILMICPAAYLLFKVPSFFAKPEIYFLSYMPYIILTLSVFYLVLKDRHYKPRDLFLGQLLGFISFSVHMRAAFSALVGVKTTFGITRKTKGMSVPYAALWPQLGVMFLNFVAIVWGVNRFIYEQKIAIVINMFWALYTLLILSSVFYFNKAQR